MKYSLLILALVTCSATAGQQWTVSDTCESISVTNVMQDTYTRYTLEATHQKDGHLYPMLHVMDLRKKLGVPKSIPAMPVTANGMDGKWVGVHQIGIYTLYATSEQMDNLIMSDLQQGKDVTFEWQGKVQTFTAKGYRDALAKLNNCYKL